MNEIPQWLIDFTTSYEDFKDKAYYDTVGKKWTIGYGTTYYPDGTPVKEGDTATKELAKLYFNNYLNKCQNTLKTKYFPKWDSFPEQFKAALLDMAYRGGADNFGKNSPEFTKLINEAAEDGKFSKEELTKIAGNINYSEKTGNLLDRFNRRVAMLYGLYNPDHNNSINTATTSKSPYHNIRYNVNYPGNRFYNIYNMNLSDADFVTRLKDPNRATIPDWEHEGAIATHKLGYATEGDHEVVFPMVQTTDDYPWWDFFHLTEPDKVLVDYSDPKYKMNWGDALKIAELNGDTIHVPTGTGLWLTTNYKQYYPVGKKKSGGSIRINPENKGKFTETKKRTGKTTEELTHSKNPLTRKRAIFALNTKKWKHYNGGIINYIQLFR